MLLRDNPSDKSVSMVSSGLNASGQLARGPLLRIVRIMPLRPVLVAAGADGQGAKLQEEGLVAR